MAKQQCDCQYWPSKLLDASLDILLTGHHEECPDRILSRLDGALELIKDLLEGNNITAKSKARCIAKYINKDSKPPSPLPRTETPSKPRRMTLEQAKSLYMAVAEPPYEYDDIEWEEIHDEMEAIIAASGPKIAAKVIKWWEVWDKKSTAVGFVKRIRALAVERGICRN